MTMLKDQKQHLTTTPEPPYYAVIFSSLLVDLNEKNSQDYADTAIKMVALAADQAGFLGFESAREGLGISISYWRDLESIKAWKEQMDHLQAQEQGRQQWYSAYTTRIAKVEREYSFAKA